ncbi:MAG TPA: hypothetical protein VK813_14950 [Edaphobacter sp.]|jgi:hypothetical protein|nr:hypothetical protein [Edaphobacter sp.]
MRNFKFFALTAIAGLCFVASTPKTQAQVSVSIGAAPVCPYGYYDYAPYGCAPYGYYGPEWFSGGVFIGAGPWYHGPEHFSGHVDNHYDVNHGYRGPVPNHGDHAEHPVPPHEFKGNEIHDGHGHVSHEEKH